MVNYVGSKGDFFLMDPIIVHAIKTLNEINIFLDPLPIHNKEIIIIPVNNCKEQLEHELQTITSSENDDDSRGSHWSLLIFYRTTGKFYYYDSAHNTNLYDATLIARKTASYFAIPYTGIIPISGPTQSNSFDCRIYVLLAVDYLLQNATKLDFLESLHIPQYTDVDCVKKRSYTAYILNRGFVVSRTTLLSLMVSYDRTQNICVGNKDSYQIKPNSNKNHFQQTLNVKNKKNTKCTPWC